jgi:hypothetical protein
MLRSAFAPTLALIFGAATASAAFAQAAKPAASTPVAAQAPASRAKWITPIKGTASIDVFRGAPKVVGKEVWTVVKVKNTAAAPIALLRADEYWYDTGRNMHPGDTYRHRQPLSPGEVIEFTLKAPLKPNLQTSQIRITHANGDTKVTSVKKL